ncbi:helveticin J family class III bacteriocin [Lactiplantibacillus songbeiensis]|uniref:Helveticin J family class III bacteriocin n=1 Tax=Lactiplantibacillus songbeiensis TaxID=2559920 RepID=A0ABW4C420_9LACO|nr:helveticin J family class III bacteriocin [Lactiplantibacillus songbeiensis]
MNNEDDKKSLDMDDGPGLVSAEEIVLTSENFETEAAYNKFMTQHPEALKSSEPTEEAIQPKVTPKNVNADLELTFIGLPNSNVVQSIYIGTTNAYALQFVKGDAKQLLSKCRMDKEKKTATRVSTMTLYNFGHGQTLQYFSHKGKDYFWVVCKATNLAVKGLEKGDFNWEIQIGRLQFRDNTTINSYTDIPRLAGIDSANKTGKPYGKVYRVEAALSSDSHFLMIWMKNTAAGIQFSYYNVNTLNTILDSKENQASKWVGCDDLRVREACKGQAQFTNGQWSVPNGVSFQGFEFSDGQAIYISSGSQSQIPKIGKYYWGHGTPSVIVALSYPQFANRKNDNEVEGIQLKGDFIYVSQHFHKSSSNAVAQLVFRVPKSAF